MLEDGGGRVKGYAMRTRGSGVDTSKYVRKKSLATTFIAVLKSICYDYFLSLKSFTVCFSRELLIGNRRTFPLEMGGSDG